MITQIHVHEHTQLYRHHMCMSTSIHALTYTCMDTHIHNCTCMPKHT